MSATPTNGNPDPELSDIEDLRRAEHERKQSSGRVRHGSITLIIVAVLVLLALALGAVWVLAGS